jgi:hypothetical protein
VKWPESGDRVVKSGKLFPLQRESDATILSTEREKLFLLFGIHLSRS